MLTRFEFSLVQDKAGFQACSHKFSIFVISNCINQLVLKKFHELNRLLTDMSTYAVMNICLAKLF